MEFQTREKHTDGFKVVRETKRKGDEVWGRDGVTFIVHTVKKETKWNERWKGRKGTHSRTDYIVERKKVFSKRRGEKEKSKKAALVGQQDKHFICDATN